MLYVNDSRGLGSFLLGLFLICMCGLMLQIVETRVISVIVYYYMAFFAISMAMLGITAGSLIVYFRPDLFPEECLSENLAWISAALAIAVVLSTLSLITTLTPSGLANTWAMTAAVWLKMIIILVPPYIFLGMAVSLALTRSPWPVGLVYGVDLVGAASGCLIILMLLKWADAISVLIAIAAFAAVGSASFQYSRRRAGEIGPSVLKVSWLGRGWRPIIIGVVFGLIAIANAAVQPTSEGDQWRDGLVLLLNKNQLELSPPALVRWNTFSRVMASENVFDRPSLWGPSPLAPLERVPERGMNIDGSAATAMYRFDGDLSRLDFLRYDITNLAYTIRHQGRSAVIGVGGGRDLLSAYLFGFRDVTGIELNPIFIDLLTHDFRTYNHLADLPGVRLFVDDARSWFARTTEHFDLIQMSMVDTWAATGAGAFSLSENGLYTTQGWRHFLSALTPTGVLTVSRWFNPEDITETGRLLSLAGAALRERGVENPGAHLFMASSGRLATLVVANSPLTPEDLAQLRAEADRLKFSVLLSPDQPPESPLLTQIIEARTKVSLAALSARQHLDLSVTTDDRPFFFNQLNALDPKSIVRAFRSQAGVVRGNLFATITLVIIMISSGVLVLFTMIFPALPFVRRAPFVLAQFGTLYFLLIGFGFMFVEIGLIQRLSIFLGHPVYGLAIGLFGIILSTGIGSLLSGRVPLTTAGGLTAWATSLGLYLVLLTFWFPGVVFAFEGGSLLVRVLVSLSAIVPSGLLMGFGFPTGMRIVNAIDSTPTPWFWAVNGAAGVLAASLAVATSIAWSINVSLWVGAACYILIAPISIPLMTLSRQANFNAQVASSAAN